MPHELTEAQRADIERRFTYHAPTEGQIPLYGIVRSDARDFALRIAKIVPPGREQALALTKLEECVMFANAGIARSGAHLVTGGAVSTTADPPVARDA